MASEASTLPLELGGISDDRREQLEVRRQREMARQQEQSESRTGNGNFRWSPIAMIPAHLCVLIFLVFLLEKLEGGLRWPWAAVLSPLWFTDAVFIIIKVGLSQVGSCSMYYMIFWFAPACFFSLEGTPNEIIS